MKKRLIAGLIIILAALTMYYLKHKEDASYELYYIEDMQSDDTEYQDEKINLNTATKDELMTLDGIGEKKAQRIIDYREEMGDFNSIEELRGIAGISEKIFEEIKDKITV